jgi:hypothetical protein
MQDLVPPTLYGTFSNAALINDAGQVAGLANLNAPLRATGDAFLWSPTANSPVFSALNSPTVTYGSTGTITLSGHLAAGTLTPPAGETVAVWMVSSSTNAGGILTFATTDGSGNFSAAAIGTYGLDVQPALNLGYFYSGDSSFAAAGAIGSSTLTVEPAPLTITADSQTMFIGAALPTFTASYSGFVRGDTAASLTTQPSLSTTAKAATKVGSYPITATGAADPNYAISYVGGTLYVITHDTATTVTSSTSTMSVGQPVTFTATVSTRFPGTLIPTGWVDFVDSASGTDLGTAPLSGGMASLTISSLLEDSSLPGGIPHSIVATYEGDSNFLASDSSAAPLAIVVTDVPSTVAINTVLPVDASNNPTAPVGTLLSLGGSFSDSPIENRALSATDMVSWTVTLNGQPYSLPASTLTNAPSFNFTPTAVGTYVVSLTVADSDGGSASAQQTIDITSMDAVSLQNVVNTQAYWTNEGSLYENGNFNTFNTPPQPASVVLQADPTQVNAALTALNAVVQPTIYDSQNGNPWAVPVAVTLNLTSGSYSDLIFSLQPPAEFYTAGPAYVTAIVNGVNGSTTVVGHSPALTITSGNVIVNNVTFTTATNSPTILVAGGSLALRNDVIQESTGYADAAISVTGGAVDLGSTSSPGNNKINVNGSGTLVQGSGSGVVSAAGDTFQTNGTTINPLTSTTLTSSANQSFFGQSVTLTATVAALTPNTGKPTGTVTFFDQTSGTTLASAALSNGVARWTTSSLKPGGHNIVAVYSGDSRFITSSSSLVENVSNFSGFLAPLFTSQALGLGRTIPIKFQLADATGAYVTSLSAVTSLQVLNGSGTDVLTGAGRTGLRYDAAANQFVYNWQTKGLTAGTYTVTLALADGTTQVKAVTLAPSGAFQLADGASSGYVSSAANQVLYGTLTVAAEDDTGAGIDQSELDRIGDAMSYLNAALGSFGVELTWAAPGAAADVHIHFASRTPQGGASDGVLGFTTADNDVYFAAGWNFYTGTDPTQVGAGQYDFLTLATHELAHTVGLGESSDSGSVMYEYLSAGTARRTFTDGNLTLINTDADRYMKVGGDARGGVAPAADSRWTVAPGVLAPAAPAPLANVGGGPAPLGNATAATPMVTFDVAALAAPAAGNRPAPAAADQFAEVGGGPMPLGNATAARPLVAFEVAAPVPASEAPGLTGRLAGGADAVLVGGEGDDLRIGGEGRDVLLGGFGTERALASSEGDFLQVGAEAQDAGLAALDAAYASTAATAGQQVHADFDLWDGDLLDT